MVTNHYFFPMEAFQFCNTESHCWITVFSCALCIFSYYFNYFTSSAIYFHILFYNGLAVPKDLFSSNNNCSSNNINHLGATCIAGKDAVCIRNNRDTWIKRGILTSFTSQRRITRYICHSQIHANPGNSACPQWLLGIISLFTHCRGTLLIFL